MASRKRRRRPYPIDQKLEVVKARQKGLKVQDVAVMFNVGTTTVRAWENAYAAKGLPGLENAPNGRPKALNPKTQAAEKILGELKQQHAPEAGISKAQGLLYRHGLLDLARETVRRILHRQGHEPQAARFKRKNPPKKVRFFERANPNDLWQTDIMTFMLKSQYRVYLIGFMDDNSRFLVGWGLYRFQTAANVMEVFRAAVEKHGTPKELLSDNGRQYYTWRGKSAFTTMLTKMGIRHIRSRPYHPQTLGKIESFWRNIIQECLEQTPLPTFEEAQSKIGEFIEYYNFKRPHQGIKNMTPSDRYFRVAGQVQQMVEQNTAKVEEQRPPISNYTPPDYVVGNIGGRELRLVPKDAQVSLRETGPENIKSGGADESNGGSGDGKPVEGAVEGEAAQPAGEAGVGPVGAGQGADGGQALPASGSVEGSVLPVAQTGQGCPAQSAGSQEAGPQTDPAAGERPCDKPAGDADQAHGAGTVGPAPGPGPLQGAGGSGAADNPPQRVEPGTPAR